MGNQVHVLPSSPAARENGRVQLHFHPLTSRSAREQSVQAESFQDFRPLRLTKNENDVYHFPFGSRRGSA